MWGIEGLLIINRRQRKVNKGKSESIRGRKGREERIRGRKGREGEERSKGRGKDLENEKTKEIER